MTEREDNIKNITRTLSYLQILVTNNNSLNLTDPNIHAENFYRDLLNLIFDWELENTNFNKRNTANIDSFSEKKKIGHSILLFASVWPSLPTVQDFAPLNLIKMKNK